MTTHSVSHHRRSIRLPAYDYSQPGVYFVTICVHDRQSALGSIVDGNVVLTDAGLVVWNVWDALPVRFHGIVMDAFVVMPDHIHGIIIITDDAIRHGGANHELRLRGNELPPNTIKLPQQPREQYRRRIMLLPKIIGYFKMNAAKRINLLRSTPGYTFWQRNYWEHVIRNDLELKRIRRYIEANPASVGLTPR